MSLTDRIIGTFILGLAQIIATEIVLGVLFKQLHALPLFSINFILSLCVLFYALSDVKRRTLNIGYFQFAFREFRDEVSGIFILIKSDFITLSVFCLFLILVCWMIFIGYLFPAYTWDALWYHLPIIGYILQNGAIQELPNYSFIHQFINIFPKNIELIFLWNIIFLKSDVIADLSQLVFTLVGVLSIYSMAIKLRIEQRHALYSSLIFPFIPIIILQSTTNYVDVAVSILFIIAVNFLMSNHVEDYPIKGKRSIYYERRKYHLFLAGTATGILFGSKGSGPLFVGILCAAVLIRKMRKYFAAVRENNGGRYPFKRLFSLYLVCFIAPIIVMGGYWYMKNWFLYDNPVHPMEISVFGKTIFKGMYRGIIEPAPAIINRLSFMTRPFYVWLDNVEYYLYDSRLGGFGPVWLILFVPGFLISFVFALMKKHYKFLAISVIFIIVFLMYPRNWTPRYVIFLIGLGALSFGFAMNYIGDKKNVIRGISLLLVIYTIFTSNSPCITPEQIKKFINLPARERTVARLAPFNIDLHARQEYGYWIWISDHISDGDVLAYTFEPLFLSPLWNSSFTSKIAYVQSGSYNEWIGMLRKYNANYILIKTNSQEDKWIEMSYSLGWFGTREKFRVVYADDNYKIAGFEKI